MSCARASLRTSDERSRAASVVTGLSATWPSRKTQHSLPASLLRGLRASLLEVCRFVLHGFPHTRCRKDNRNPKVPQTYTYATAGPSRLLLWPPRGGSQSLHTHTHAHLKPNTPCLRGTSVLQMNTTIRRDSGGSGIWFFREPGRAPGGRKGHVLGQNGPPNTESPTLPAFCEQFRIFNHFRSRPQARSLCCISGALRAPSGRRSTPLGLRELGLCVFRTVGTHATKAKIEAPQTPREGPQHK